MTRDLDTRARARRGRHLLDAAARLLALAVLTLAALSWPATGALALKAIDLNADQDRVEITPHAEFLEGRGDSIQVETAPGPDGMSSRMGVRASAPGISPNWIVFALRNTTDKPIERWLTAERYTTIGSGVVWPDLDARRIEGVTPSLGFLPERLKSDRADIFRITLEPGQTVTYAAELASDRFAPMFVWKPIEYELKARDRLLLNGSLLGITGVLGIFLTAVFAANHKPIFPSAALVTWCVMAYLCVDFGFWHKMFQLRPEDNAVYRAATEAAMAASLLIFLYIFLRLAASHGLARMLLGVWIIAQLALIAVAVIDARLASTFARASFAAIGGVGMLSITYLALRGQDRALALSPTWMLFLVWIFAAAVTLTGRLSGDAVVSSLSGGLVLITVLLGFTVTQFAFRTFEPMYGADPSEQQLRSLAIDGSGAAIFEWSQRRDEIKCGTLIEATLGLNPGELSVKVDDFCAHLHPADRERFRLMLTALKERAAGEMRGSGELRIEFRMLHADNSYRWFELDAAVVPTMERRALRCVGLLREITETKRAQERLLHDAVHDSLTGLPNRELFLDRLALAVSRAAAEPMICPAVMLIDIDRFKSINASFGLVVGDSLLLTLARRLQHRLGPQDTLARIGGNQFAVVKPQAHDGAELAQEAEEIRRSLRSPTKLAGQDIVLTGAIGIAVYDKSVVSAEDLLKEAEVAMYRAKRTGADRIEIFRPEFRSSIDDRAALENDLRAAIESRQLSVLYQPIISLATEELAGFEAQVRWQHPRLGMQYPASFVPIAEGSDLIVRLGSYVLKEALTDAAAWHRLLPRTERQLFVSINVSCRQLFRQDLLHEIRQIASRAPLPASCLRLEITESLVMENPERAVEMLEWLRAAGVGLSLDDFGAGYSSLSYLQRFPFDTFKIDRDLMQSEAIDQAGNTVVRSIVALAHELGKKVVAEGVEMPEDVAFLRTIGCEYAQGAYYDAPIPQRDVEKMLRKIRKRENRLHRNGMFRTTTKQRAPSREPPSSHATNRAAAQAHNGADAPLRKSGGTAWSLRARSRKAASKRGEPSAGPGAASMRPDNPTAPPTRRRNGMALDPATGGTRSRPHDPASGAHSLHGPVPDGPLPPIMEAPSSGSWANGMHPAPPPMPPPLPHAPQATPHGAHAIPPINELQIDGSPTGSGPLTASQNPAGPLPPPPPMPHGSQPPHEFPAVDPIERRPDFDAGQNGHAAVPAELPATPAVPPPPHHPARPREATLADLSTLPPAIARSLAKLAKTSVPEPPPPPPSSDRG